MPIDLRALLKRNNLLVNAVRVLRDGARTNCEILDLLAVFSPNSAGSRSALAVAALKSAQQTLPLICSLIEVMCRPPSAPRPIETIFPAPDNRGIQELAALFNLYGSDKSSRHNYHLLYAPLLAPRRRDQLRLLEIGIGTTSPDV